MAARPVPLFPLPRPAALPDGVLDDLLPPCRPLPQAVPAVRPAWEGDAAFLERLGQRVRAARRGRGMTRKALACRSGVSERHLAQVEGGRGNISILLLRAVARALDRPLEALVGEDSLPSGL